MEITSLPSSTRTILQKMTKQFGSRTAILKEIAEVDPDDREAILVLKQKASDWIKSLPEPKC